MPLTRRLTQVTQVRESLPDDEVKAVKWLQQAEAILICAGDIFTSEADAGIFRPSPLTARGGLEHGIPAQGSWTPVCALWREHLQLDSARLFESDAALAWAYWGFWCKCYLEEAPNDFYRYLGTWACSRSQGCFCVTEGISGHWARTLGEESIWETRGSVSHLQRVDGCDKVWRVGETRMSLTTQRIVTGITSQVTGMRDGLSIATSALTSLLDNSKSKSATSALSKLKIKPEGTRDSKLSPTPSNQNSNQTDKVEQKSADAADIVRARISQTIPTLEIKLPLPWSLQAGEAVEVRTRDPVENSSAHRWSAWHGAVVAEDGFSVSSNGHPERAHAVRRPKGQDLLRADGDLPRDPEDSSSLARPNVSMCGDTKFTRCRCDRQEKTFYEWLHALPPDCRLVVLEVGLGTASQEVLQAQRAAHAFPNSKMIRIGSTRLKKPQSARCCGIFGKTSQGMQRLMEVLGDVSESVPEGQTHAEENEDSMEQPAGNSDSMVTPSANEGSDHRNNDPLKSSQAEAAEADGLMHWDEIENTGEPDNGDAFAQLAAMASGMFSAEPDETDN